MLIKRLPHGDDLPLPQYMTAGASGMDICSAINTTLIDWKAIPTGFAMSIPKGYEIQVRPRSGLALKGITVLNSPGTIDSDYTQEIKIILVNITEQPYDIKRGDRIAQLVVAPVCRLQLEECQFDETDRGGFGSTGK